MKITTSSSGSAQKGRKSNGSANSAKTVGGWDAPSVDDESQQKEQKEMIAVAAYFRAERRGFAPGDELGDWFQAEAEYQAGVRSKMN